MLHRIPVVALACVLASHAWGEESAKAPDPPAKGAPQLPDIRLDIKNKTVEIDGTFCVGDCPLELLVCQNTMKDYESMISSPAKPSLLHTALLALGLKPRVRDPKEPGRVLREGDPVDVFLRFTRDGKEITVEPCELIVNVETKQRIRATPFVFFGSFLFPDPEDEKRMIYLGDSEQWLIGLLGDTASVIDLPPEAAGKYGALGIDAKAAPPKGSKVTVVMRPARDRKPREAADGK